MMHDEKRQELLRSLAALIERQGLAVPAQLLLDAAAPLSVMLSQTALFLRPFAPQGRWYDYACLLEDSANWQALRTLLAREDY